MLLRSSSTPILRSWLPTHYTNTNSFPNNIHGHTPCLSRTNSYPISAHSPSSSPSSYTPNINHSRQPSCNLLEFDLYDPPYPRATPLQRLFSSSGLDEVVSVSEESGGSDGGGVCGGDGKGMNGGDGHGGQGSGFNDSNNSNEHGIEAYYQKMIKVNPGDPLLLSNYAKFLKDVRGDLAKAEEYCGRAILENPSDGSTLSMYAEIIWQHRRDTQGAESYFDQAIKAAPKSCYVHASYAKFLWDMEDEEVREEESQEQNGSRPSPSSPPYMEEFYRPPFEEMNF